MTEQIRSDGPALGFRIIGLVALLWNLIGVAAYYGQVTMTPEQLAALNAAEQEYYAAMPAWATGAFAVSVFGGTLGAVLLLLRRRLAVALFLISLVAVLIQATHTYLVSNGVEMLSPTQVTLSVSIIAIALFLPWYAHRCRQRGWLR